MKNILIVFFIMLTTVAFSKKEPNAMNWPREIIEKNYTITLYQPQLEKLKGNILDGRLALSIQKDNEDLIFGALWFSARISTDMETRMAVLESLEIPKVKFPDIEDENKIKQLKTLIINDIEKLHFEMSIDRILASVEDVESENSLKAKLANDPPEIYFRTKPTVLAIIDGNPVLKETEDSNIEYVVNTPFFIVKYKKDYYLKGGEYWYIGEKIESDDWKLAISVPKQVQKAADKMMDSSDKNPVKEESSEIPDVIVTTHQAELILSSGKLAYEPIKETSLLYVSNSENDIIMDITSQQHFVLINGRWYSSKTLKDGEWSFIEPDALPKDFASIPEDATIASVRVSVPGTVEAQEAKYEQQMPQTAVVDRKTASTKVEYDGDPKFEKMDGTDVKYAVNTQSTVIQVNKTYYCVDNGIWFESANAKGPWIVSDNRPDEIDEIPPSAPVYNVKYVYIYDSTPDVVYVGYTPGYYHSYYYGGVVVYGTGYYYQPWYGMHYYPRPVTYGFGVHYNPYTGWGFSVGVSYGWFTVSAHSHYGHSYWGPAGYRHGYRHGYNNGYHRGYHNGYAAGYARGRANSRNVYNNHRSGIKQTGYNSRQVKRQVKKNNSKITSPSRKPNNVFADKTGNVMQRDTNGNWNQKNNRNNVNRTQTPQRRTQSASRSQLERDYSNRSRANVKHQNYSTTRSSRPVSQSSRSMPSRSTRRR